MEELQKGNDQFKQDMAAHIKDSDELWNEAQGGQTPWEQIITWSLIGLSLTLTVILAGWLGRLQLFVWKGGKSQSRLSIEELQEEIRRLNSRMMDLETDVQLADTQRRPPAYFTPKKSE